MGYLQIKSKNQNKKVHIKIEIFLLNYKQFKFI